MRSSITIILCVISLCGGLILGCSISGGGNVICKHYVQVETIDDIIVVTYIPELDQGCNN